MTTEVETDTDLVYRPTLTLDQLAIIEVALEGLRGRYDMAKNDKLIAATLWHLENLDPAEVR